MLELVPKPPRARWPALIVFTCCTLSACQADDARIADDESRLTPDAASAVPMNPARGDTARGNTAPGAAAQSGTAEQEPAPNETARGPLPDLVLDTAYLADTIALDSVTVDDECLLQQGCVSGLGERTVVRFGSRTGNVGDADLVLGAPNGDNSLWTFNTCRQAFDLPGFARYALVDVATGEQVAAGAKHGSCVADAERWIEASAASCEAYDCSRQGITQGCADNYGSALECQWVDITDVPGGTYELSVTINADRQFAELDYANDVGRVRLSLGASSVSVER